MLTEKVMEVILFSQFTIIITTSYILHTKIYTKVWLKNATVTFFYYVHVSVVLEL